MEHLGVMLATTFTGVFGGVIGFVLFIVIAVFLGLPFILLNNRSDQPLNPDGKPREGGHWSD